MASMVATTRSTRRIAIGAGRAPGVLPYGPTPAGWDCLLARATAGGTMQRIARLPDHVHSMPDDTSDASFERVKRHADTTHSAPAKPDHGESSASTIVEAPLK